MEGRQRSGDHNILKLQRQLEAGRHKEYEHDLHQLRRLDIDPRHRKAQHGASADTAHHNDRRKRDDPHNGIEVSPLREPLELPDHHRHHQADGNGSGRDHKLLYRACVIQTGQHDHADTKQHTHVVDHQPGHLWIDQCIQQYSSSKQNHLHKVERQKPDIVGLQIHHQKSDDMDHKHQHILIPQHPPLFIRILKPEYAETGKGIHCDHKDHHIF